MWTCRVKPINCNNFFAAERVRLIASMSNWRLSCQRFYALIITVIGIDFDQEMAEKMAPPNIARLTLANCILPTSVLIPMFRKM